MVAQDRFWLLVLDCSGIQPYVFGSYRLADNIGASFLVESALDVEPGGVLRAALDRAVGPGRTFVDWRARTAPVLPSDPWRAVVVYVGGGNAAIVFADEDEAGATARALSCRLLDVAPGLRVNASRLGFQAGDPARGTAGLGRAVLDAFAQLNRRKLADRRRLTPVGHPVARTCRVTGLPAAHLRADGPWGVAVAASAAGEAEPGAGAEAEAMADVTAVGVTVSADQAGAVPVTGDPSASPSAAVASAAGSEPGADRPDAEREQVAEIGAAGQGTGGRFVWLSSTAAARRDAQDSGNLRLERAFATELGEAWEFPHEFEQLGGRSGERHIAVVHADGNGVGRLLHTKLRQSGGDDVVAAHEARALSRTIADASNVALRALVDILIGNAGILDDAGIAFRDGRRRGRRLLPFRPIVYGGDDVTFVCDGRLGIQLAGLFLQEFAAATGTEKLDACAGVVVVRAGFPFTRAYELAEQLCASAKERRRERDQGGSWLDFQIVREGAEGRVEAIRQRNYAALDRGGRRGQGSILQRPWQVTPARSRPGDLAWLLGCAGHLVTHQRDWSRSRVKHLFERLDEGAVAADLPGRVAPSADELRRLAWRGVDLGPFGKGLDSAGFHYETSPLYDVLDALDYLAWPLLPIPAPPVPKADITRQPARAASGAARGRGGA